MRARNIHAPHFTSSSIWKANDTDPERYDQELSGTVSLVSWIDKVVEPQCLKLCCRLAWPTTRR